MSKMFLKKIDRPRSLGVVRELPPVVGEEGEGGVSTRERLKNILQKNIERHVTPSLSTISCFF